MIRYFVSGAHFIITANEVENPDLFFWKVRIKIIL
jgi:hypothetical protein